MKRHSFVERRLKAIAQDVEDAIDCTQCANCCRVASTQVTDRDADHLARFLGMKLAAFLRDYTVESTDEGRILKRNENGCIFLEAIFVPSMRQAADLSAISAPCEREWLAVEPHVAHARPGCLLPHRLQFARSVQGGDRL